MATPAKVDVLIDEAMLTRLDADGALEELQHALHNAASAVSYAQSRCDVVCRLMAGEQTAQSDQVPGPLFRALEALRALPAIRRARMETAVAL